MIAPRLITYGVYALGALLILIGLYYIVDGASLVRMEIGSAEIISGSLAACAGWVIIVLGLLMGHLDRMQASLHRLLLDEVPAPPEPKPVLRPTITEPFVPARVEVRPVHPLAPAAKREQEMPAAMDVRPEPALTAALHPAEEEEPVPEPTLPEPQPVLSDSAPDLLQAEEKEAAQGPTVAAPDAVADSVADAPPARGKPNFLSSLLPRRMMSAPSRIPSTPVAPSFDRPVLPFAETSGTETPRRTSIDLSSGWGEEPETSPMDFRPSRGLAPEPTHPAIETPSVEPPPSPATEAAEAAEASHEPVPEIVPVVAPVEPPPPPPPLPEPDPLQPVVVGRYNAGSASYVMYSNGMIEVETEQGTHQFASMQDLKAFIEKRDARVS